MFYSFTSKSILTKSNCYCQNVLLDIFVHLHFGFLNHVGLDSTFQWSSLPRTFFLFLVHVADHLHKWSQRCGYACGTFMSQVSSSLCGAYPTLSPSSLVPYAFVPARVRRCHAFHHSGGFSIRSSCLQSLTLQYLQRNYHVAKNASLVLALGYFDEALKHVSGLRRNRLECGHRSSLKQTPLCLWFGYGTLVLVISYSTAISTLWRHDRGTRVPSHVTR